MYEQPVLPIADPEAFGAVKTAIESSFAPGHIVDFLASVARAGLRVRDFELVLSKDLLGAAIAGQYHQLDNADQGQIRELYLASLEKVTPELRQRFLKLYAYY